MAGVVVLEDDRSTRTCSLSNEDFYGRKMRNCNFLRFSLRELLSEDGGSCGNEDGLELVESSPGQVQYIHRADAASQID